MFIGGRKEEMVVVNISAATAKQLMRLLVWWPILEAVVSFTIGIVAPRGFFYELVDDNYLPLLCSFTSHVILK
jgi:hypothetical protein